MFLLPLKDRKGLKDVPLEGMVWRCHKKPASPCRVYAYGERVGAGTATPTTTSSREEAITDHL